MIKYGKTLAICLAVLLMAGCGGPPAEKIEKARSVYSELVNRHNEVIEVYADVEDNSLDGELDGMAEKINLIGQQDVEQMSEEELDATIEELQANIAMYDGLLESIGQMRGIEPADNASSISVTIRNNTGVDLQEVYLYRASEESEKVNLAEDIGGLGGFGVLSIVNIYMTGEETVWHLEALDTGGKIIESADIGFDGYQNKEVTINMEYSFDSMEGWIELE
ncbi:hypothetical protein EDD76_11969 [Kineothrix alysoides]|uniref:DUF5105 domain-containing protein n=1 Tax=Kineothrix alysoides TaxID=1469948 RepID=A0A4R1QLX7_9FIRM|nr:hypothetical protein [Kineothrix alysoides]TCL54646.1 hypothetical protein EDD76_11969 [Kineothrix alysoides]